MLKNMELKYLMMLIWLVFEFVMTTRSELFDVIFHYLSHSGKIVPKRVVWCNIFIFYSLAKIVLIEIWKIQSKFGNIIFFITIEKAEECTLIIVKYNSS